MPCLSCHFTSEGRKLDKVYVTGSFQGGCHAVNFSWLHNHILSKDFVSLDLQITLNLFSEFKGIFVLHNDGHYEKNGKVEPSSFDIESFWYFKWLPDGEASELENSSKYDTDVISKGDKIPENQFMNRQLLCVHVVR